MTIQYMSHVTSYTSSRVPSPVKPFIPNIYRKRNHINFHRVGIGHMDAAIAHRPNSILPTPAPMTRARMKTIWKVLNRIDSVISM
jgi:hypothetical protein